MRGAEHLACASKTGEAARHDHRQDNGPTGVHAGVPSRSWVESSGAEFKPLCGPEHEPRRPRRRDQRDDQTEMHAQLGEIEEQRELRGFLNRNADGRGSTNRLKNRRQEQSEHDLLGNGVEHDRGDHLMGARLGLEDARNEPPQRPACDSRDERHQDVERPRHRDPDPGPDGEHRADLELTLSTDVEDARSEGHGNPESREDQRRRGQECLADGPKGDTDLVGAARCECGGDLARVAERSDDQGAIGLRHSTQTRSEGADGIRAELRVELEIAQDQDDAADDEGRNDRQYWKLHPVEEVPALDRSTEDDDRNQDQDLHTKSDVGLLEEELNGEPDRHE